MPRKVSNMQKEILGIDLADDLYVISHTCMTDYKFWFGFDMDGKGTEDNEVYTYVEYKDDIKGYNMAFEPLPMSLCILAGAMLVRKTGNGITTHAEFYKYENEWYKTVALERCTVINGKNSYSIQEVLTFVPDQIMQNIARFKKYYNDWRTIE